MVFITQLWKSAAPDVGVLRGWVRFFFALLLGMALLPFAYSAGISHATSAATAQLTHLRTERTEDGIYLNAAVSFELPHVVEDALLKGIPMFFVIEVDVFRDRWYWRVNIGSGLIGGGSSGLRATFNQNYDTLPEAMSVVQQVARWKVADSADIRSGNEHNLVFSFKLDLSQLPRPFQIGVAGQRDWTIAIDSNQPLQLQTTRPGEPGKDRGGAPEGNK
jgi:hypothetical protein